MNEDNVNNMVKLQPYHVCYKIKLKTPRKGERDILQLPDLFYF